MQETILGWDGEASWDDVFGQLHPDKKSLAVNPLVGPIPVANIESFLRDALTKSNLELYCHLYSIAIQHTWFSL